MPARPCPLRANGRKPLAAIPSTLQLQLGACGSALFGAVLGQPGLIVQPNSFQTKSSDTWKDPARELKKLKAESLRVKKPHAASFSFEHLFQPITDSRSLPHLAVFIACRDGSLALASPMLWSGRQSILLGPNS